MAPEDRARIEQLIEVGRELHRRGWVPATSGNLSVRLSDGTIAITRSGCHKGRLLPSDFVQLQPVLSASASGASSSLFSDFVQLRPDGTGRQEGHPSAETGLHLMLYRKFPETGAVLHPHTPASVVISRIKKDHVVLEDQELLKAFSGITTHETRLVLPIFENDQNIPRLAAHIASRLKEGTPAFILKGHGLYTWGREISEALRHLEAVEFLLECELRLLSLRSS